MARSATPPLRTAGVALLARGTPRLGTSRLGRLALGTWVLGTLVASCAQSDAITGPGEGGGPNGGPGPGSGGAGSGGAGPGVGGEGPSSTSMATGATTSSTSSGGGEGGATTGANGGGGSSSSGPTCGDDVAEGDEACDGADLAGATCADRGLDGGVVACTACELDYAGCMALLACENGVDDDADGLVDAADPACTGVGDADEAVFSPSCDGGGGPVVDLSDASGSPWVRQGTTVGAPEAFVSNLTASCPTTGGPEVAFRLVVPSVMNLDLSLESPNTGANWDPVLYVRSASCAGVQIGCNDDGGGGDLKSRLQLSNVQPGTYYVFIDSTGSVGAFELTVTSN